MKFPAEWKKGKSTNQNMIVNGLVYVDDNPSHEYGRVCPVITEDNYKKSC